MIKKRVCCIYKLKRTEETKNTPKRGNIYYIYVRKRKYLHAFTYLTNYLPKPPINMQHFLPNSCDPLHRGANECLAYTISRKRPTSISRYINTEDELGQQNVLRVMIQMHRRLQWKSRALTCL